MNMPNLLLYHFPGACSQVTLCALEEAKLTYETQVVNLLTGEQTGAAYKKIVPTRKVPALRIDGHLLVENAAILFYIAGLCPEAGILPEARTPLERAEQVSALAFCGGTLHPLTRAIFNPSRLTAGNVEDVRSKAKETAATPFGLAEKRLKGNGWWFGRWSIVDNYLNWNFTTAKKGGLDPEHYPMLAGLHQRLMERPAYAKVLELEAAARLSLGV